MRSHAAALSWRAAAQALKFVERRFQPHLQHLPAGCSWQVHLVGARALFPRRPAGHCGRLLRLRCPQVRFRRPFLNMGGDEDALIAYSLCRKDARLGCSGGCPAGGPGRPAAAWSDSWARAELVLKGKGQDSGLLSLLAAASIPHLCSQWSRVPVRFWHPRRGWRLQQPLGVVPPGHSLLTWRRSLTPEPVPVIDGHLVQQPDGVVSAVYLDDSMRGAHFGF